MSKMESTKMESTKTEKTEKTEKMESQFLVTPKKFCGFRRIGQRGDSFDFGRPGDYDYPVEYKNLTGLSEYQLQRLFVDTIRQEADKADQSDQPIHSYRILTDYLGRKSDGLRTQYGFGNALDMSKYHPEKFIDLEHIVIRANNPYRLWTKLYDYCDSQDAENDFIDDYLLPKFDDNDYDIYEHTTPIDIVNMVLKIYEKCNKDNIYWVKLHEL